MKGFAGIVEQQHLWLCSSTNSMSDDAHALLIIIILLIIDNIEEPELVHALTSRDNTQPIPQLLLLQVLLREVLEVSTTELLVRDDFNFALALLADLDCVAEVAGAAVDLYAVVQELLEGCEVEDFV